MPNVDFTLEDIAKIIDQRLDKRFIAEREHTQQIVHKEVNGLRVEFQSFIDNNFTPAIDHIEERFDRLDGRVDYLDHQLGHLATGVAELRMDMRHVKQHLRSGAKP